MPYGLTNMDMEKLQALFRLNKKIERVILYGSRAKGTFKPFSDVDITFIGEKLTRSDLNQLAGFIDDLLLPYRFDLSLFFTLKNKELVEHIERRGIVIYEKNRE